MNFLNPKLKDLFNSKIKVIECLIEWRKQKYNVKARTGVKKKFNIITDKKSIIISILISKFFLLARYIDDNKLKIKSIIRFLSLKIKNVKTSKFKVSNISFV